MSDGQLEEVIRDMVSLGMPLHVAQSMEACIEARLMKRKEKRDY